MPLFLTLSSVPGGARVFAQNDAPKIETGRVELESPESLELRLENDRLRRENEIQRKALEAIDLEARGYEKQAQLYRHERNLLESRLDATAEKAITEKDLIRRNIYWPGAGHLSTGYKIRGGIYAFSFGALTAATIFSGLEARRLADDRRASAIPLFFGLERSLIARHEAAKARTNALALGAVVIYGASLLDAVLFGTDRLRPYSPGRSIDFTPPPVAAGWPEPSRGVSIQITAWRWRF